MTDRAPLPSLFGRFSSVLKEHDHLKTTLHRLRTMCATLEEASDLPRELLPEPLFEELFADLKSHFTSEESPAYFGTVVEESPALAPQINMLKREHMDMLMRIEELLGMAQDRQRWRGLAHPTRQFVAILEQHERAESTLLRELFFPPK
ncbi:MAG TPA: hemerythrin domain-containing protein [Polyangiaceae bacterium]|nr:hemerythrin domain-containing protein [Polyangiaceae bacterium]